MKQIFKKIGLLIPLVIITFFMAAGCNEDAVAPQANNFEMSYMSSPDTTDAIGLLVLSEVKLLVKDIKLNVANSGQDTNNFKVGPYVLSLNLNSTVTYVDEGFIPAGTYDKVRFMVHKLNDNEAVPDPDFADANGRYSVVVRGTFAGVPFTYKSDKSAHQKLQANNSLIVSVSGKTNITLRIKPYIWFIKDGVYLDPNDPNNRNEIDKNIKDNINNNFKFFKDDNKDGQPD